MTRAGAPDRLRVYEAPDPERAWSAPGVYAVAPSVFRIPLELPDEGLHSVNVYALPGPDGVTLIDPGQAMPGTNDRLGEALSLLGSSLAQVSRILVTHLHRDHYTNAVMLRRRHGTPISLGAREAVSVSHVSNPLRDRFTDQLVLLHRCGSGDLAGRMAGLSDGVEPEAWEPPDVWLRDGIVSLPDRSLEVISTPGHTRGHVVFSDPSRHITFTGDHVLPHITPSIGFEAVVVPLPLGDYLNSLRLMLRRPDSLMLPAHGAVGPSVHRRVEELLEHHASRLEDTWLPLVRASTADDVASQLRWTRRRRCLDEMSPMNQMLAVLETKAHLDVLVSTGRAACAADDSGVLRYERATRPQADTRRPPGPGTS